MEDVNGVLNFLLQKDNYYLGNDKDIEIKDVGHFLENDFLLYHIEEIAFEESAARKEAIENILSFTKIDGTNFLYLVIGDEDGIHFYFGIARNLYYDKEMTLGMDEIGEYILKPNIEGNLIGSKITALISVEKKRILDVVDEMEHFSVLEGIPGINSDAGRYMDTLVNVMEGNKFGFMIISNPLNINEIWNIEDNLSKLYTLISSLSISNVQESVSNSNTSSIATTVGESFTNVVSGSFAIQNSVSNNKGGSTNSDVSENRGKSETVQGNNNNGQSNRSTATSINKQEGTAIGENWGKTVGLTININVGYSRSNTTNSSITEVQATSQGTGTATTIQTTNKAVQEWIKYMDDVLFPRLDYGKGSGVFNTSTFLFANEKAVLKKLENITRLLFAGETGNKIPIKVLSLNKDSVKTNVYKKFQLPHGNFPEGKGINNPLARSAISQYLDDMGTVTFGNWVSTNELSSAIAFPKKDISGLSFSKPM